MTTAHTTTGPVKIPARELRKGDKISMGVIDTVTPHETYVSIRFESKIGIHGTAFPLDLEVTVISRAPDPAPDLTTPMLMAARGLKPGHGVIDELDGTTVHTVLSVVTEGTQTTVEFVGGVKHLVSDIESYRVTRLSAMAVYHARQSEQAMVAELTALADTWDSPVSTITRPYRSFSQEDCAQMLRELLARLRA